MAAARSACRNASLTRIRSSGLVGLPWLRQPQDLLARAELVRARCDALVAEAVALPPSVDVLHTVDRISESLCSTLDVTALIMAVHPDPEWLEAADDASTSVGNTMARLNTDRRLYDAVQRVRNKPSVRAGLSSEQVRFVELISAEFEADGVHLPAANQARVHELGARISRLSSAYMGALVQGGSVAPIRRPPEPSDLAAAAAGGGGESPLWVRSELLGALPNHVGALLVRDRGLCMLPDDPGVAAAVLKWCAHEDLRRAVHRRASMCAGKGNLQTLAQLLEARLALARELGFASHTAMAMAYGRMASGEEEVSSFLGLVEGSVRPKLQAELAEMARAKRARTGEAGAALGAWDVPFYTGLLKARRWQLEAQRLSDYFELESALGGLSHLVSRLFGLSLQELPMDLGEAWAPQVRKFALLDTAPGRSGEPLGTLYLDLFSRERKQPLSATFTLSAGDRRRRGAAPAGAGEGAGAGAGEDPADCPSTLPLPTVAIVCSFSSAGGAAGTSGSGHGSHGSHDGRHSRAATTLLAHSELTTLYHEFGHALHALLARTEMQHLSGVRGPLDFVECPSLLFERFASDWRVLRTWATHVRTGERIPEQTVRRLRASAVDFAGYDSALQLHYSRADLAFHGPNPPVADTTACVRALHESAFGPALPWVEGCAWHASFSHLVGYSGGYYSYLWCRALSAQLWHERFAEEPLSASAGAELRQRLLEPGNAQAPADMMGAMLRGKALSTEAFVRELTTTGAE